ncbi:MAG: secreted protein [Marmoricola sp.]|nr:secreted protein [Marmoricola sp.]
MRRVVSLLALLGVLLLVGGGVPAYAVARVTPLPVGTDVDYQLGGARAVPAHVGIVVRDRRERPLSGTYGVCYVNAFQTQPDEQSFWRRHPGLVLRKGGRPVVDSAWGEQLLDLRTSAKRAALAGIVGTWLRGCARSGYAAAELDNLDSFTRSRGLLSARQAIAYARLLVARAHAEGLAVGQKNWASWDGRSVGFDFAVAEECGRYRECADYTRHYGRRVLAVEYRASDFEWTCSRYGGQLAVVLRDVDLTPGGVRRWC